MAAGRKLDVIIDTREQTPWVFSERVTTIRDALPTGDYSLVGARNLVTIERKTLNDFVGTVIGARKRFTAELERMQAFPYRLIVVEGSLEDILRGRYTSKASPTSVLATAISLHVNWKTPVLYAGSRPCAAAYVEMWFDHVSRAIAKLNQSEMNGVSNE